ncbi:MAG TPA: ABC transporter permease [Anaerolineales bacterium]|nr:ABC transporter permease [Anaerolineales bacterium]
MITRLWSLIRKEFIQIIRDPRTLAITFVMPVVQMLLLGYSATNDVRNVPLAVWDQSRSAESRELLAAYRAADYFQIAYDVAGETEIHDLIDSGAIRAAIIIPPDYAEALARGEAAEIAFVIDGSDPTIAGTALSAATLIGQARSTALTVERLAARGQGGAPRMAIDVRTQVLFNPDLISAYYMVPALVGLILQFLTIVLTSGAIVRERERGTIEQLIVTPIRSWELVVGKLTPYVFIAFFDSLEVLVVGKLLFDVPINGSLLLLLSLTALFLVTTLGLGLLISTLANTQQEATITSIFFNLPAIFLSGFFYPLAAMPPILQWLSYLIPLRYFLVVVRGITLKGVGLESLWFEVAALVVFSVVIMGSAALRFRKRLD